MSNLDMELSSVLAARGFAELRNRQASFESIASAIPRLPFDGDELRKARTMVEIWRRDGHDAALGPLDQEYQASSDRERMAFQREGLLSGFLFVSIGNPFFVSLLVVKSDEGRGFFGGQKVGYVCYCTTGDNYYFPIGRVSSISIAVTKLSNVLRSAQ